MSVIVISMLDWLVENIPQFLLSEPINGLFGLIIACYIITFLFRRGS